MKKVRQTEMRGNGEQGTYEITIRAGDAALASRIVSCVVRSECYHDVDGIRVAVVRPHGPRAAGRGERASEVSETVTETATTIRPLGWVG